LKADHRQRQQKHRGIDRQQVGPQVVQVETARDINQNAYRKQHLGRKQHRLFGT
jgi:hypothetical protein